MKHSTKRILALVLSLLMLISTMSVYAFAGSNYVPDDEYYERVYLDSVVVNVAWADYVEGDTVTYEYRGETITETFDPQVHFASLQDAYDFCIDNGQSNPTILVPGGTNIDNLVITTSVTILGANAGVNPSVPNANDPTKVWGANPERKTETILKGVIEVRRTVSVDVEVVLDGVMLHTGFALVDGGNKKANSSAILRNSTINGAGATTHNNSAVTSVFYYADSKDRTNSVTFENVRAMNMNASTLISECVANIDIDGLFYTTSSKPALQSIDANTDQNPDYRITNSMFYSNTSPQGVLSIDHTVKDSAGRTSTNLEISGCVFLDDMSIPADEIKLMTAPIQYTVLSTKNVVNIHDCIFKGSGDYTASPIAFTFSGAALTSHIANTIKFNSNKLYGFCTLPNTSGIVATSKFDFTGNYYANNKGKQSDPVYPIANSYNNIQVDYYWLDEAMTVPSDIFYVESTGITNAEVDHAAKTIESTLDYGDKVNVSIKASDPTVKFDLFDENDSKVTSIDSTKLISGFAKNKYYAVGTSTKIPDYEFRYEVIISTYDPNLSIVFDLENTYMLDVNVAEKAEGESYYKTWDGMLYEFVVGETVFDNIADIFNVADEIPTVLIPSGIHTGDIVVTESVILLGAKHGINPNLPQFDDPDIEWKINPDRADPDQETILENCVIYIAKSAIDATITLDGFTMGKMSGYRDDGEGVVTYTTSILKNILIDGAGGASYNKNDGTGTVEAINSILSFGGSNTTYKDNHKDVRLINIRMTEQGAYPFIGNFYETLLFDGVCYSSNSDGMLKNEWRAPSTQDFYLEMRHSNFYMNETATQLFLVNCTMSNTDYSSYNRIVLDHNIFFDTSTYAYGIYGVRFASSRDSMKVVNNIMFSSTCDGIIPGSTNWFLGLTSVNKDITEDKAEIVDDIVIRFNRFIGCAKVVDLGTNKEGTCWDFSYNFFNTSRSFSTTVSGTTPTARSGQESKTKCEYYYSDYALTKLVDNGAGDPNSPFKKELSYRITGPGSLDEAAKTYTDTVSASTETYDFGIILDTKQAKYGIYTDEACTVPASNPVQVVGGKNEYFIKFSSFDDSVNVIYKATITKPLNSGAIITKFGNCRVTDDAINAFVPVGTTTFNIPAIDVSVGADYAIYNDADCTVEFTSSKITKIGTTPVVKYVKVTSEDGNTTNVYMLSVIQSVNDQGELTYIEGAEKVTATSFEASIPSNVSSFDLYAEYSDGATITVYDGDLEIKPSKNGAITIDNIAVSKTVTIVVTSSVNVDKEFTLTINKDTTSCLVTSIFGMVNNGDDTTTYETKVNKSTFKVLPTLENSAATYVVYSNRTCTNVCADNVVNLTKEDVTAYLKVTSADGSTSKIYTLNIKTTNPGEASGGNEDDDDDSPVGPGENTVDPSTVYKIVDAKLVDGVYYIEAGKDLTSYDLKFELLTNEYPESYYRLYTDDTYTTATTAAKTFDTPYKAEINGKTTVLYFVGWVRLGNTTLNMTKVPIVINSNRSSVTYSDASSISSWARAQVDYLNKEGYGFFVGDDAGKFNPKSNITRFEVAVIATRVLGINVKNYTNLILPFVDNVPDWASDAVKACYSLKIMNGVSEKEFNGKAPTTRQEFSKIIVSTLLIANGVKEDANAVYTANKADIDAAYNAKKFADEAEIASWAKPYVRLAVASYGLMNGSDDNGKLYINPKNPITREQVAILLANYCGYKA